MTDKQPDRAEREAFESWYNSYNPAHKSDKQRAKDAYAAALAEPQQAAPAAEWLEQAYREGWAACRDAETIGQEAEDWAFGNSTANSRMIDMQQAAPQQEVQESVRTSGRNCYLCGHPEEAHPMEPNPRGGMRRGKCPTTTAQPAPSGDAESLLRDAREALWQPSNPEICKRIDNFLDAACKEGNKP